MRRLFVIVALLAACATGGSVAPTPPREIATPAPVPGAVSRADYGDAWPLTVESGVVRCDLGHAVVFHAPDGTDYALNGIAMAEPEKYKDLHPIWADDPGGIAPKLSIGPLIELGLNLCSN